MNNQITIREYLNQKGVPFRESHNELITKCLFNDCDADSRGNEAHLYFNAETGQYNCKKCDAKGNLLTLATHFGDTLKTPRVTIPKDVFSATKVEECHAELPERIRQYLNVRGITDEIINTHKIGYGSFYKKWWITIPIKNEEGEYIFFKLRQDPGKGNAKHMIPAGHEAQIYGWETLIPSYEPLVVCEGELDRLVLLSKGVRAITGTAGAGTFKQEWVEKVRPASPKIFVCFDGDSTGKEGAEKAARMIAGKKERDTYVVTLPEELGDKGDITDYFGSFNGEADNLFNKYARRYPEQIDTSKFAPLTVEDLVKVLDLTIKHDVENKVTIFLCQLSAYTEEDQFNVSLNAPSSTGKSFIPMESAQLYPQEDVIEVAYASPTAFFHDAKPPEKEGDPHIVDLARKILIFTDQPHTELIARLRPLLSHDKKEILIKITDRTQKSGMRTKNILLRGYPSVIFCTASVRMDEQEATRLILLSPEISQEKIHAGVSSTGRKEANRDIYVNNLDAEPARALLKERIRAIKMEGISQIIVPSPEQVIKRFIEARKMLKPRHQRDIKRIFSLIKAFALLNVWYRNMEGSVITANEDDIESAFLLWDKIAVSQELGIPPYLYKLYLEVILPAWEEKNPYRNDPDHSSFTLTGIVRQDVLSKHYQVYGRMLDATKFRQQFLPILETAGLIVLEQDPSDKRVDLIFPNLLENPISNLSVKTEKNSEQEVGAPKSVCCTAEVHATGQCDGCGANGEEFDNSEFENPFEATPKTSE